MGHYLIRVMASLILGMEVRTYLSRNTRDESVIGSVLWARLLVSTCISNDQNKSDHSNLPVYDNNNNKTIFLQ